VRHRVALLVLFACCLLGSTAATQYFAKAFRYDPALGAPLVVAWGVPLYSPIEWYRWKHELGRHALQERVTAVGIALGGLLVGVVVAPAIARQRRAFVPRWKLLGRSRAWRLRWQR
jgi:hypothetical protein